MSLLGRETGKARMPERPVFSLLPFEERKKELVRLHAVANYLAAEHARLGLARCELYTPIGFNDRVGCDMAVKHFLRAGFAVSFNPYNVGTWTGIKLALSWEESCQ